MRPGFDFDNHVRLEPAAKRFAKNHRATVEAYGWLDMGAPFKKVMAARLLDKRIVALERLEHNQAQYAMLHDVVVITPAEL